MEIRIERRAGEQYPSIVALIKALNDATFTAKRALPIVGICVFDETTISNISKIVIIDKDGKDWDPSNLAQKPYGLFIE